VQIKTVCLDAGGVLVVPNWQRVSAALGRHGIDVGPEALSAAEPYAKRRFDQAVRIATTTDEDRRDAYFEHILMQAGVRATEGAREALAELRTYHGAHNLWETVPGDVPGVLGTLRSLGLQLVVVSNANGRLRASLSWLIRTRKASRSRTPDCSRLRSTEPRRASMRRYMLSPRDEQGQRGALEALHAVGGADTH